MVRKNGSGPNVATQLPEKVKQMLALMAALKTGSEDFPL